LFQTTTENWAADAFGGISNGTVTWIPPGG
jgi:hypothetical protein